MDQFAKVDVATMTHVCLNRLSNSLACLLLQFQFCVSGCKECACRFCIKKSTLNFSTRTSTRTCSMCMYKPSYSVSMIIKKYSSIRYYEVPVRVKRIIPSQLRIPFGLLVLQTPLSKQKITSLKDNMNLR